MITPQNHSDALVTPGYALGLSRGLFVTSREARWYTAKVQDDLTDCRSRQSFRKANPQQSLMSLSCK